MENFRIESLEINKIGAFEHIKMDFPKKADPDKAEIHILTGENGTGKSTILMLLASIADNNNYENIYKRSWKYKKLTDETVGESEYYIYFQNQFFLQELPCPFKVSIPLKKPVNRFQEGYSNSNYQSYIPPCTFFAYSGNRYSYNISVTAMEEINSHPLKDAVDFDKSVNPKILIQWIANIKTKELFAKNKKNDAKANNFKNAIDNITNIISEIITQEVDFDFDYDPFEINLIINNQTLSFDTLPDGLKSMISWIGDLLMRMDRIEWEDDIDIFDRNFILFLDEIEVHLHPAWQRKILPVVQKLFKNAQIFISTHSPFVVGSVDGAWVHKLKKGDDGFAVLDGEPVLSEDAESYDTILEEIFGIKERFGDEIEVRLKKFRDITKEILKGDEHRLVEWNDIILFFENQKRPDEIMSYITPQIRQINRIRNQVVA